MANLFNSVKIKNPKRNTFNLSHSCKLTTEFGRLTPIMCEPVLPADKFNVSTTLKVRFAPLTLPVMERFKAYIHYWFVPNRILWDNWETFITGGDDGISDQDHPYPVIKITGQNMGDQNILTHNIEAGSLYDYLGFPAKSLNLQERVNMNTNPLYLDALPFKAYQLIYDEFYRDQNLEQPMDLLKDRDGTQNPLEDVTNNAFVNGLMSIRYRAWKKDYFTSALPDPQRGPDVTLPSFGELDVLGEGTSNVASPRYTAGDSPAEGALKAHSSGGDLKFVQVGDNVDNDSNITIRGTVNNSDIASGLSIDRSETRMATINEVRRGFALQRLYELAARVGGRYAENILGNFGVHAGDARLQRPEYLGGSVVPIFVGDVLQTSETTQNGTPLGMPAGVAGTLDSSKEFSKTFYEHGWIIGILSIVPEATYMQGMPRKFLKRDRLDFAWPKLANIGEQEIEQQEIYFKYGDAPADQKATFGYTPRYAEYRFSNSGVHGDFRTTMTGFHDARIFDSAPALNAEFIKVKPTSSSNGLNRIFAVTSADYDHLWVHLYNHIIVRRKLPKYGTPI